MRTSLPPCHRRPGLTGPGRKSDTPSQTTVARRSAPGTTNRRAARASTSSAAVATPTVAAGTAATWPAVPPDAGPRARLRPSDQGVFDPAEGVHRPRAGAVRVIHRMYQGDHSPQQPPRPTVTAVIPAWNEAQTIGAVVYAALDARLVDEVVVVDNASTDQTATVAATHGARVVCEPVAGKGEAMRTGVAAAPDADVIVFLDADLIALTPDHVDSLVAAVVEARADMACGLFDRGPVANPIFLGALPVLTGQRAVRRELFEQLDGADTHGYRVEAALNSLVAQRGLVRHDEVLRGLWHRTKEEKMPSAVVGHATKLAMLASACWSYLRFAVARRTPQPAG
ncbi:MAG TPA: glycosyltransferase [Acidimicrobiales bacterium]